MNNTSLLSNIIELYCEDYDFLNKILIKEPYECFKLHLETGGLYQEALIAFSPKNKEKRKGIFMESCLISPCIKEESIKVLSSNYLIRYFNYSAFCPNSDKYLFDLYYFSLNLSLEFHLKTKVITYFSEFLNS